VKCARPRHGGEELVRQLAEDIDYYERARVCRTVVGFSYDPEGLLHYFANRALDGTAADGTVSVRWVVGSP
jgi:hypothetical protein